MIAAVLALISLVGLALTQLVGLYSADAVGALIVTAVLLREGLYSIRICSHRGHTAQPGIARARGMSATDNYTNILTPSLTMPLSRFTLQRY